MNNKIMVIEDDEDLLQILTKHFTDLDFEVLGFSSGPKALEALKASSPQMFLIDLHLPEMNGIEICRKIREELPVAIMYAMTGYADTFQIIEAREAGFDDYFVKPFKLEAIQRAVDDGFTRLNRWRNG